MQVIFSKYTDLLPKEVLNEDTSELQKPDEEVVKEVSHAAVFTYGERGKLPSDQVIHGTVFDYCKIMGTSQFSYFIFPRFSLLP